ncbi:S-layer homology domain-containing protein [Cohnella sp. GCM10020058]|uniref:S-layer homology domain-containing protein n=1 Tax=Cohnella sp. GCM10020058 TaxID=3317330 RepID=UPI00362BA1F0
MKKSLFTVLIMALLLASPGLSANAAPTTMKDVANHWAKSAIEKAVSTGYVAGYPDNTFKPNNKISRAEFIKMVDVAFGYQPKATGGSWYRPYADLAITYGIHDEADFKDYTQNITRLEIMRIVSRALGTQKSYHAYLDSLSGLYNGDIPFTDYKSLASKDIKLVALAIGSQVVSGYADNSLGLKLPATRAEAVVMIERALEVSKKEATSFPFLKEFQEVSKTGTNATSVSPFTFYEGVNLSNKPLAIQHPKFTGSLKRVYVIPAKAKSIFEKKFLWNKEEFAKEYFAGVGGYVFGVLDITAKSNIDNNTIQQIQVIPSGLYDFQKSRSKYGFEIAYPDKLTKYAQGAKFELVVAGYYGDKASDSFDDHIILQTSNATSGSYYYVMEESSEGQGT